MPLDGSSRRRRGWGRRPARRLYAGLAGYLRKEIAPTPVDLVEGPGPDDVVIHIRKCRTAASGPRRPGNHKSRRHPRRTICVDAAAPPQRGPRGAAAGVHGLNKDQYATARAVTTLHGAFKKCVPERRGRADG